MKGRKNWFQLILNGVMLILGGYIIYEGIWLLGESAWFKKWADEASYKRWVEDLAVTTYMNGFAEAVLGENGGFAGVLADEVMPAFGEFYGQARQLEQEEQSSEKGNIEASQKTPINQKETEAASARQAPGGGESGTAEEQQAPGGAESGTAEKQQAPDGAENGTGEGQSASGGTAAVQEAAASPIRTPAAALPSMEQLESFDFLMNQYFILDPSTSADASLLDAAAFLEKDFSLEKDSSVPQILIYHTHSQEAFADSVEGDESTTIVGIGDVLTSILENEYGYCVIHNRNTYDLIDGVLDRNLAYNLALPDVEQILAENPTIEVVIDLHRDGVDGKRFVSEVNGRPAAQLMFFNGLSRTSENQAIDYLYNPYLQDNLAFSFQLQLKANQYYPGLMRNIYLSEYRFNLHTRPRSLLVESGTQLNTVEEEKNAMVALADILDQVLSGE